jgi:uncharacterized protein YbjQ (UPF0145 family)
MSLTTSSQYDTNAWEVKSMVLATHTEAVSLLRGFIAGVGGIFGGQSDSMNKKVDDVMSQLITKLKAQMGPGEMIIGASFQFTEFGRDQSNTFLSGIATGTLLRRKGQQQEQKGGKTRKNRRHF